MHKISSKTLYEALFALSIRRAEVKSSLEILSDESSKKYWTLELDKVEAAIKELEVA